MTTTEMPYRRLGAAGVKVSALSLGGWTTFGGSITDQDLAAALLRQAFDAGVNFFDIADVYAKGEAEKQMGAVLRHLPRHELVISSKVYWPMSDDINDKGLSRKHIIESCEKSLKRIGTDYLDIYFCHRFDEETPVEETARAMDHLIRQGKVLYWGTSEWTSAQLRDASAVCDKRNLYAPAVEQPQYSLLARAKVDTDVLPVAQTLGLGLVVWSPLASGVLTGKYDDGIPEGSRLEKLGWLRDKFLTDDLKKKVKKFADLAKEHDISRTKLALAWCLARPGVSSVIMGATTTKQLEENLGALEVKMTPALMSKLNELFA